MQELSYEILLKQNAEMKAENAQLKQMLSSLKFQLAEMKRLIIGAKSEKFISTSANATDNAFFIKSGRRPGR